jgi:hypothetical protein
MKTNQNMIRKMGNFDVIQRTKDGMFYATGLLTQWNNFACQDKRMNDFFESGSTKEYIEALKTDADITASNDNQVFTKVKGGSVQGTWMHPYLFVDFAMWLNPKFKLQVIKFVYDELIKHRHLAGDNYNKLCAALSRFSDVDYQETGKMLNYVIFNNHERGMRNTATPEQEEDLQQLERDMIKYIDMGFVNSFEQFKSAMRKEWGKRNNKVP